MLAGKLKAQELIRGKHGPQTDLSAGLVANVGSCPHFDDTLQNLFWNAIKLLGQTTVSPPTQFLQVIKHKDYDIDSIEYSVFSRIA